MNNKFKFNMMINQKNMMSKLAKKAKVKLIKINLMIKGKKKYMVNYNLLMNQVVKLIKTNLMVVK